MITIKELKEFLGTLPEEFDEFPMVNGEVAQIDGEFYVRVDKPVLHLEIDEQNKEMLVLHQPAEEIEEIEAQINGDSEGTTE
jgi:alpha-acetolactate decarboxylase